MINKKSPIDPITGYFKGMDFSTSGDNVGFLKYERGRGGIQKKKITN